ncbi:fructose bisphosphate aldolase [Shinella zoogloeoides]|uniref:fructose bisphosphate aldolase n=1 Tax=Shinella zoogloeoides TaxID=352475 RepID=UPI0028A87320|nr:fructose bisphosphate aldolase [Shinella zoogloeoides]
MTDAGMMAQMTHKQGFIAALDQSGGSTPGALRLYGIDDSDYSGDGAMFRLMHEMRVRIMTAPAFSGDKVIGAILFEGTMNSEAEGKPVPSYLWEDRGVVPFLKIDKGLAAEENGVQMMKSIPDLDAVLGRAARKGIFGTKMRSVITHADRAGIMAVVKQQFQLGRQILAHGLVPIIEPEVSINSPTRELAETILSEEIARELDALSASEKVMLKLTIPTVADFYKPLVDHNAVIRVVALSGGFSRAFACKKLSRNHGIIASFSRALTEDLRISMSIDEFFLSLKRAIDQIYTASTTKVGPGN